MNPGLKVTFLAESCQLIRNACIMLLPVQERDICYGKSLRFEGFGLLQQLPFPYLAGFCVYVPHSTVTSGGQGP